MEPVQTNWYVITGGPSAGKSTLLAHLQSRGYSIIPEVARTLIDEGIAFGKTLEEIRSDELEFQKKVLQAKLELENSLATHELVLMERGILDSAAFYQFHGDEVEPVIQVSNKRRYKKIFFLEQAPFEKDYARTENDETARTIGELSYQAYRDAGYEVVRIPLMPIEDRVKLVLEYIKLNSKKIE